MKYYIIAGEASGDLHGSNLMKSLYKEDAAANIRFWGGDLMRQVGGVLAKHYKDLAFMGFVEVLFHLKTILNNIKICKKDIENFQPDVIVFIDYPGFNLRIAKWAKKQGFKTHYYISPQIWAWKESRITEIKRDIDKMYVILPFEKDFYEKKHHYPVEFVGHPLIDAIQNHLAVDAAIFRKENQLNEKPIIAVLPGSRKQEITKMLSIMLSVVDDFKDYQFVIAGAPSQEFTFYEKFVTCENIRFVSNRTYNLLSNATVALVTSGTATLETALFKVITLKYISLVNLIMNEEVVIELIQEKCSKKNLQLELNRILDANYRQVLMQKYDDLEAKLGGIGASKKTAKLIVKDLK